MSISPAFTLETLANDRRIIETCYRSSARGSHELAS
jgi:hypothetical protein